MLCFVIWAYSRTVTERKERVGIPPNMSKNRKRKTVVRKQKIALAYWRKLCENSWFNLWKMRKIFRKNYSNYNERMRFPRPPIVSDGKLWVMERKGCGWLGGGRGYIYKRLFWCQRESIEDDISHSFPIPECETNHKAVTEAGSPQCRQLKRESDPG